MTRKSKGSELSVFKGVEAKSNLAIFSILVLSDHPLGINEMLKQLGKQKETCNLYYNSLTKRLRILVEDEYLKKNKVGSKAATYQLTNKALLAMFWRSNCRQEILDKADETQRGFLLLALMNALPK